MRFGACRSTLMAVGLVSLASMEKPLAQDEALPGRAGEVLVVANERDAASMELAEAYRRARSLPAANLLALPFEDSINLQAGQFRDKLMDPLLRRWNSLRPHPRYIVLMRGVPYRTGQLSTTAGILFDSLDQQPVPHGYFGETAAFDPDVPWSGRRLRPATVLSGYTVSDTLALIDNSQEHYPVKDLAGSFYFCQGQGPRGVRNRQIQDVIKALRAADARAEYQEKPELRNERRIMGYFTGKTRVHISSNSFMPGALAGNLTSYGGYLLDERGHTSVLSFVRHGAAGGYGTVVEPTNASTRWPHLGLTVDYAQGATLSDAYLRRLMDPSLGVVVGDPLCAPFSVPPAVDVGFPKDLDGLEEIPPVSLSVVEGAEDSGLSRIELWLDERVPLFEWQPSVPAATECRLSVGGSAAGEFQRRFQVEEDTPISTVLKRFRGREDGTVVDAAGRFDDRLVVHVGEPQQAKGELSASLVLDGPKRSRRLSADLAPDQRVVVASAFSLGRKNPAAGDSVTVSFGNNSETVRAEDGESLVQLVRRVSLAVEQVAETGDQPHRSVQVRKVSKEEVDEMKSELLPGFWILLADGDVPIHKKVPLEVETHREDGSEFADGKVGPDRRILTLRGSAWAVLQPRWPVAEIHEDVPLPGWNLKPGTHVLTCIAEGAEGGMRIEHVTFRTGPRAERPQLEISQSRVDAGDSVRVRSVVAEGLPEGAVPVLIVNGRPLLEQQWTDDGVTELSCAAPDVPPGQNRIRVEWLEDGLPASEAALLSTVNRTTPTVELFVRRPLAYRARIEPQKLAASTDGEIVIRGPYLHNDVRAEINGKMVDMQRSTRNGAEWRASVGELPPGEHRIRLVSQSNDDQSGVPEQKLVITEPDE